MLPSLPMHDENYLPGVVVNVDDDLLDQRSCQSLLRAHVGPGSVPDCSQVRGEVDQVLT